MEELGNLQNCNLKLVTIIVAGFFTFNISLTFQKQLFKDKGIYSYHQQGKK